MYVGEFLDQIAAAEQLVRKAPHVQNESDLLEGLQYLAGCIAACTRLAFDSDRDHPFLQSGTGPFTKMALDNPDTLYFGTWLRGGHDYVLTGRRGTTTDLSFQTLGASTPTTMCRPANSHSTTANSTSTLTAVSNGDSPRTATRS